MASGAGTNPEESGRSTLTGDLWGGVATTLVALPASIAFGVAMYSPLGEGSATGALAGLLGATALGTLAPLLGGTPRLVSAPCAPAVAVMATFAADTAVRHPHQPARALLLMALIGLLAAVMQLALGLARAGTIIKYIPHPVVTGYLSGVGVVLFLKQLAPLLGLAKSTPLWHGATTPTLWAWPALVVAGATIAGMTQAPRLTRAVPPAILGLAGGALAYVAVAAVRPDLRALSGNALVIGPLGGGTASFGETLMARLSSLRELHAADVASVLGPATTLAVVLSLDTLKTCVVVDAITGSRHESNRELFGQGVANAASAVIGGIPGSGTSGPTLVNIASGGRTRWSAALEGVLVLFAFLTLRRVVAWAPLAALAGILTVVAYRMIDWSAFRWATHRSTVLDFGVVAAVIAVAVGFDLIAASATGVVLSILLFIRDESRAPVIRRKLYGNAVFSKRRRLPAERAVLVEHGAETVVVQLAGSLFFGTTDQLRTLLQPDLAGCRTIVFDMRRVDALDMTAVHIFEQMRSQLGRRGARMVFCNLPPVLAGGRDPKVYLREAGLIGPEDEDPVYPTVSDALAPIEDRLLAEHGAPPGDAETALELAELDIFKGRKPETVADAQHFLEPRSVPAGQAVFERGQAGDEIFFIRRGTVKITLPVDERSIHVASFGRGDFFGEIAFLDGGARTARAVAETDAELFVISREKFDAVAAKHPRLGQAVFSALSRSLALRLRSADADIATLEEA